ncbi:hypothetical protein EDD71_12423 [Fonticella tunisiensis]|uniref:Uncharacterized protein n=1 Tax=Fonticella tunisiensis TaxID=1096341 RepID=A0A4R7K9M1_9CLOT|nr:hypothetical protein EDD71_12423 [Fonticella tunisiensis]
MGTVDFAQNWKWAEINHVDIAVKGDKIVIRNGCLYH